MHRIAYVFVGLLALVAMLTVALRLFLPGMTTYKDEIVAYLSEMFDVDVQVGDMQVILDGMQPQFRLSQVAIDAPGSSAETMHIEELRVEIDLPGSLLGWQIKVSDLYIAGADFLVVTDKAGNSSIAGFLPVRFPSSDAPAEFAIPEITFHLERADVRWRNEQLGADYQFANTQASFEYRERRLKTFLDARLPEPLGRSLRLSVDLEEADASGVSGAGGGGWSGRFYLDVDGADMQRWARLLGGPDTVAGVLTAELRGDFQHGKLQRLAGSVACGSCKIFPDDATQDAVSLQTSLLWMAEADGWILELPDFGGEMSGIDIRNGRVAVDYGKEGSQVALQMSALDVSKVATAAAKLGWPGADEVAVFSGLGDASWSGFIPHPPPAELSAALSEPPQDGLRFLVDGIGFLARYVAAYFRHLRIPSGIGTATARLAFKALSVRVPDWSQRVFDFDAVGMDIHYLAEPRQFRIENLSLYSDDLRLSGELAWMAERPRTVNAKFSMENLALVSIKDLLPEKGLQPRLRQWLDNAFIAGVMDRGGVEMNGALSSFPFSDRSGRFSAWGEFTNVTLNYRADRQPLRNIDGRVVFDNEKLVAEATRMSYYDWDFQSARAVLDDIRVPFVAVVAAGEGPMSGIFSYLGDEGLAGSGRRPHAQPRYGRQHPY